MTKQSSLRAEIEAGVKSYGNERDALMPILEDLNRTHSYISEEAMLLVAEALNMPRADVYGVVTFYSFFSAKPRGRYVIRVCRTISCDMRSEAREVREALLGELGIAFGETTADNIFTLEQTNCIGMCDQGPAMLIGEDVHVRLTGAKVREILRGYRQTATEANRTANAH